MRGCVADVGDDDDDDGCKTTMFEQSDEFVFVCINCCHFSFSLSNSPFNASISFGTAMKRLELTLDSIILMNCLFCELHVIGGM